MSVVRNKYAVRKNSIDQKMRLTKGLETSPITVPFTAGNPKNLQHYWIAVKA
jgi:hypothetical protein